MIVHIENQFGKAAVDTHGAQLVSFQNAKGEEYLWQGDKKYWSGQAPVLFPIVGALRDKKTIINGKTYEMAQHGFARHMEFEVTEQKKDSATFTLVSSDETKKMYPFDFSLQMTYRFENERLVTEFKVENTGDKIMPFAVGGHPAFNCPLTSDETFEDYIIEFEKPETAECPEVKMGIGLIDFPNRYPLLKDESVITLKHSLFYKDALIFDSLKSRVVTFKSKKSGKGIRMDFADFRYLGIWSAVNDAPFVALEPWSGCATGTDENDEFIEKRGMTMLPVGKTSVLSFGICAL